MKKNQRPDTILIALGGNALINKGETGTIEEQFNNLSVPLKQAAELSLENKILITHGNGPQVGSLLLQQESCGIDPKLPLEILVAQTEGQIGYMIESTLDNELMAIGIDAQKLLVTLITYVVVNEDDPAFLNPSKPIGPIFSEKEAALLPYPTGKTMKGWRRLTASPKPVTIVEKREIGRLLDMDFIVICCGGGGIPVIKEERRFHGVNAVIDKDLASAKLAEEVGCDLFIIATDVDGVYSNYKTPDEILHKRLTLNQAEQMLEDGRLPPGSMGPKVEAAAKFVKQHGGRAVITNIKQITAAVEGRAGTEIVME